jgi:hypothetical protein
MHPTTPEFSMKKALFWTITLLIGLLVAACQAPPAQEVRTPEAPPREQPTLATLPATSTAAPAPTTARTPSPAATTEIVATATPVEEASIPTPTSTPAGPPAPTTNYGPAPEIDTEVWLNTDVPLRLADLRGKVALIEFWTYG